MSRAVQGAISRLPVQKLLIEVLSIVLAVLLALGMNQWRETLANRALAQTALANIELELRSNQDLLVLLNENNRSVTASIHNEDVETESSAAFVPGLQLQEIAWNALLSTGVSSYVDYDTVLMLSKLYSVQEVYKELGTQIVQAELNSAAYAAAAGTTIDEQQKLEQFAGFLELLVAIEIELLQTYEITLVELDDS